MKEQHADHMSALGNNVIYNDISFCGQKDYYCT